MSVFAAATGIGSWPGTAAREAAEIIVGELHSLPHLPELPARGVGADTIGRTGALLVDIGFDTVARAYRIAPGRSAVMRRAMSWLNEDIDALEEAWEKAGLRGSGRPVKVQAAGPITLAAELELANGHRAITDAGALRDLAGSLSEGLAAHRAEVARRLGTEVVVQLDEPSLPAAMLGRLTGVTRFSPVHPVEEQVAAVLLDEFVDTVGGAIALHSCAADLPWRLLQRSKLQALAVDVSTLRPADLDGVGEFVESGRTVLLGVVPGTAQQQRWTPQQVAAAAASVTDRLGFPRTVLRERIGISPACGLSGASEAWARVAIGLTQKAADGLETDPEGI
ncbi:methionine synthase [Mycobacterium sp. MBM]|nr:methionine synthase [Mycobacterium sp. MBM]